MIVTIYQIKMAMTVFLSLYTISGMVCLIVWRLVSSSIAKSILEHNLDANLVTLINTIDVSLHSSWLLYQYFFILGILLLIYAVWGAASVFLENVILLKVFGFLLLIISSMKVPIVTYALHQNEVNALSYAKSDIWSNFEKSNITGRPASARNFMQDFHSCCGVNNYKDYNTFEMNQTVYPKSCCHDNTNECFSSDNVIHEGCAEKIANSYSKSYQAIGVLSLLLIILEVLATVLSFYLQHRIKERKRILKRTSTIPYDRPIGRY